MAHTRIPIRGVDDRSLVRRVIDEHRTGARKVKPLVEYQTRPLDFMTEVLGFPRHTLVWSEHPEYVGHSWDGTIDPLVQVCRVLGGQVPGKRHVAIEAATGTQKTYTAAGLGLWFLGSFENALVITTAPKEGQLKEGIWKELADQLPNFRRRFPKAEAINLKVRMRPVVPGPMGADATLRHEKWSMIGWCAGVDAGAESAVRSQGFHAEHMLIIVEEFPGMDAATITALKNTCTAPHNIILGLGNPDHQLDPLHTFSQLPGVAAIRISALDHPNVVCANPAIVPGATSQLFITTNRAEYGETGPLYRSRVRGMSPKEAHNALIKISWLEEAARKWEDPETYDAMSRGPKALGCDPAQTENGDRCALARWKGSVLTIVETLAVRDALAFGEEIWKIMKAEDVQPAHVGVDAVGIGSNVVNYLRRVIPPGGGWIREIQGGEDDPLAHAMKAPVPSDTRSRQEYVPDANHFLNLRAQVYWQFGQDLQHGLVAIPRHEGLWRELTAPTYSTEGGVVRLQKKKEIVKKLGRSPDYADAVVYGNWVRSRTVSPDDAKIVTKSQGVSLGFDYTNRRPREATDPIAQELAAANLLGRMPDLMLTSFDRRGPVSRSAIPRRRGR